MKVIICGDRYWDNVDVIRRELEQMPNDTIVVHGACRRWDEKRHRFIGADYLAGVVARDLGFEVREYPAQWGKFGRAAGPIRNEQMLLIEWPSMVIAFHGDIENSKGTKDMVGRAIAAGITVKILSG